ncbi:hypothetical protein B1L07_12075 [Stenotrophomonas acidaminiphila]|nr:hypothetical protein B1L07_12075 [Stenotrophomonas acidaminiphila]
MKLKYVLLCLAWPLMAFANDSKSGDALNVAMPFSAQAQQIRKDLYGETYSEISSADRQSVADALQRMEALIGAEPDTTKLEEADKVQLFNDQELVNTVLTKARADSRVVCKREMAVGSHRTVSQCLTVAERRRIREQSTDFLKENQRNYSKPNTN